MAQGWGIGQWDRRAKAVLVAGTRSGEEIVLAKPRTFMNNSGEGILYLLARFKAQPEDLLIVYDEMELPLGRLRIRASGSAGGHNGIKSIISALNSQSFPRLRVGIGHAPPGADQIAHVIGPFSGEESKIMIEAEKRSVEAVDCILETNIDIAMNRFNTVVDSESGQS
jgi:PTH1 family peptidyl-tRNA hydrolase